MFVNSNTIFQSSVIKKIAVVFLCLITAFLLPRFITKYGWVTVAGGAIIIPLIVAFFLRPKIGLLGFIATDFILGALVSSSLSMESFTVSLVRFMGFIVLTGWIVRIISKTEKPGFINTPQNVLLLLYFLASMASTFFSKYPNNGLLDLQTLSMQIILYYLIISMADSPVIIKRIVWILVLVAGVSVIIGIYQLIFLPVVIRLKGTRLNSTTFAATNIIYLPVILFQLYNVKSVFGKVSLAILAAFVAFNIVSSGSRAALITFGFVIVLFIMQTIHQRKGFPKGILVIFAVGVIFLILINSVEIPIVAKRRIFDIPSPLSYVMNPTSIEESSARRRALQIQVAKEMFMDSPILGHGPRTYIMLGHLYYPSQYYSEVEFYRAPHNIYIALLTEHGILGTVLFLCLIWLTFKDFRRAGSSFRKRGNSTLLNWTRGIEISYAGFLFWGLSSATGLSSKFMFIAMALAPVLRKFATQRNTTKIRRRIVNQ